MSGPESEEGESGSAPYAGGGGREGARWMKGGEDARWWKEDQIALVEARKERIRGQARGWVGEGEALFD
jgi:hypothetical protein